MIQVRNGKGNQDLKRVVYIKSPFTHVEHLTDVMRNPESYPLIKTALHAAITLTRTLSTQVIICYVYSIFIAVINVIYGY